MWEINLNSEFKKIQEILELFDKKTISYNAKIYLIASEIINKKTLYNKGFKKLDEIIHMIKFEFETDWKKIESLIFFFENPVKSKVDQRRKERKGIHNNYKIDIAETNIEDQIWEIFDRKEKIEPEDKQNG